MKSNGNQKILGSELLKNTLHQKSWDKNILEREICSIIDYVIKEERLKICNLYIEFTTLVKEQQKINRTTRRVLNKQTNKQTKTKPNLRI